MAQDLFSRIQLIMFSFSHLEPKGEINFTIPTPRECHRQQQSALDHIWLKKAISSDQCT